MTGALADRAGLLRERLAVQLLFLFSGLLIGTWTARIPAVKRALDLSDGQLSVALLALATGSIVGMQAAGRLVDRYGAARVLVPVALADGALLVLPGYAPNLAGLALCLIAFGAVHGALNIAMNAHAVAVERAWQRPIMSSFHAVYSIGGFAGAGIGGAFAQAGLSPATTFAASGALALLLATVAARGISAGTGAPASEAEPASTAYPASAADPHGATDPAGTAGPHGATDPAGAGGTAPPGRLRGVGLLGLLAFCCLVGEGAAADWSSVYLRDSLGSSAGLAAGAYAAFSLAMMAGRLAGDRLTTRFGPVGLVRGCGVLAGVGLGTALLVGHPVAGLVGFGCLGAGLSCIAPQVFSAAGHRNPTRSGSALARVVGIGYLGFFVGPVLIGGVAELSGLPAALAIPALLAIFVALSAPALRIPRPA
ncbi:MFS transporter [Micromonospora sp. NPDC049559]|uniref:MFS transporter n=1 Tax=Micromonospora sp. NPDC049559 TaxID=3155923 RepID=UPI00344677BE